MGRSIDSSGTNDFARLGELKIFNRHELCVFLSSNVCTLIAPINGSRGRSRSRPVFPFQRSPVSEAKANRKLSHALRSSSFVNSNCARKHGFSYRFLFCEKRGRTRNRTNV